MGKRLLLLAVFFSVNLVLWGQGNTVTPYSAFGLGELFLPAYPKNLAMGGVGVATFEPNSLNRINPATYADLLTTTIDVGGFYRPANLSTSDGDATFRSGNLTNLHVGFKGAKGPAFVFGLAPYSTVSFNVREVVETGTESEDFQSLSEGSGGINEFFVGIANDYLRGRLAIGANLGVLFGNNTVFYRAGPLLDGAGEVENDPADLAAFPTITREDRVRGFNYRFGITYTDTLKEGVVGRIGATVSGANSLTLTSRTEYSVGIIDFGVGPFFRVIDDQFVEVEADTFNNIITQSRDGFIGDTTVVLEDLPRASLNLPLEIGFGLGFRKFGSHAVHADVVYQAWSDFTRDGVNGNLQDAYRVALGGEWLPDLQGKSAFARMTYRAGFRYEKTYLRLNGTDIQAYAGSVGVAIPVRRSLSRLNLAFEYGIRGTTSNNLIQENYFQFAVGINFAERWFVRRKFN